MLFCNSNCLRHVVPPSAELGICGTRTPNLKRSTITGTSPAVGRDIRHIQPGIGASLPIHWKIGLYRSEWFLGETCLTLNSATYAK
jgi:hypothetical protein